MKRYYGHGKLLLSGEYLVLDGAESLALPTKKGQSLECTRLQEKELIWRSFDENYKSWLEVVFTLPELRLVSATYSTDRETEDNDYAERLQGILLKIKDLNSGLFTNEGGFLIETYLEFNREWGLGSSSTLIHCLSKWAEVDPYELLSKTFGGSGYDLACAGADRAIIYTKDLSMASVEVVDFDPSFKDNLFFVYLNQKMNSREGIKHYREQSKQNIVKLRDRVSQISRELVLCSKLKEFENLMSEHESILSELLNLKTAKELHFSDYPKMIKSLGAWGGDFVMVSGDLTDMQYFKNKGYEIIIPYQEMIL
jgi:mevalonate kinase